MCGELQEAFKSKTKTPLGIITEETAAEQR